MNTSLENLSDLSTSDLLNLLPSRFIDTEFDLLYVLHIFKSKNIWTIRYQNSENKNSYIQDADVDINKAAISMLKELSSRNINFYTK